jgi:hypothetical protein
MDKTNLGGIDMIECSGMIRDKMYIKGGWRFASYLMMIGMI